MSSPVTGTVRGCGNGQIAEYVKSRNLMGSELCGGWGDVVLVVRGSEYVMITPGACSKKVNLKEKCDRGSSLASAYHVGTCPHHDADWRRYIGHGEVRDAQNALRIAALRHNYSNGNTISLNEIAVDIGGRAKGRAYEAVESLFPRGLNPGVRYTPVKKVLGKPSKGALAVQKAIERSFLAPKVPADLLAKIYVTLPWKEVLSVSQVAQQRVEPWAASRDANLLAIPPRSWVYATLAAVLCLTHVEHNPMGRALLVVPAFAKEGFYAALAYSHHTKFFMHLPKSGTAIFLLTGEALRNFDPDLSAEKWVEWVRNATE